MPSGGAASTVAGVAAGGRREAHREGKMARGGKREREREKVDCPGILRDVPELGAALPYISFLMKVGQVAMVLS